MFCIGQSAPLALKSVRRQQGTPGTLIPDQTKAVPVLISSILLLANIKFYTVRRTFNSLPERTGWENESSSLKALDSQPRMNFLPWQPMAGELRKWTAINIHKFCALFFIKNSFLLFIYLFIFFCCCFSLVTAWTSFSCWKIKSLRLRFLKAVTLGPLAGLWKPS